MTETARAALAQPAILDESTLTEGLEYLSRRDAELAGIRKRFGPPPVWSREPGFATLIHIILEQQLSLASAKAAYERLLVACKPLTPERFLELDDVALKKIGFSRQKIIYGRHLAQEVAAGRLDLESLSAIDDSAVKSELMKIKGIGAWTADIYLLRALLRTNAWPSGDLALAIAVQEVKALHARPSTNELEAMSRIWEPWRAVAARLLWLYYLKRPRPAKR
jgi:DNA-3-methyladenine glycosylase II